MAPQEMKGSPSFHAKLFFLLREPLPEPRRQPPNDVFHLVLLPLELRPTGDFHVTVELGGEFKIAREEPNADDEQEQADDDGPISPITQADVVYGQVYYA